MAEPSGDVCALIELIAKSLVDAPDEVFVEKFDDGVIELEVAESDVGKVIGRQGRTARALRALLNAAGQRARKRYTLEIIEQVFLSFEPRVVSPETDGEFVSLARVVKTQGRHGEVAVEVHSDVPDRFAEGMKLLALLNAGEAKRWSPQGSAPTRFAEKDARRELEVEALWPHKGLLVVKFCGIDSISDAEVLIGSELQVPRSERGQLEPGWNFVTDLVGCVVFDRGHEIGRITDVQFGAGEAPLLIVDIAGKKFDVPFAEAYLEAVDIARREVRMNLPDGMLEINAPMTEDEKLQQGSGFERARLKPRRKGSNK